MHSHDQMAVDLAHINARPDGDRWRAAWRAKDRWYARWDEALEQNFEDLDALLETNLDRALGLALKVHKADDDERRADMLELLHQLIQALLFRVEQGIAAGREGAIAAYAGLGVHTGTDAGQFTLDALGLNRTFAWASMRDFIRDELAVRGSKIIHHAYGYHVDRLARLIINATSPREPKTIDQVRHEILAQWPAISRSDAQRIARTETGIIWERTNWYAMRANGVQQFRWLIAHGPSIGTRVGPVCPLCIEAAKKSPYTADQLEEIPPAHPNCRCTLVPVIDSRWLPPAQPWTGSEAPMPTGGLDTDSGRIVPKDVQVFKARRVWGTPALPSGWSTTRGTGWST